MKAYLQLLIWMVLFAIVIQMIFPDSSFKKYMKLILGCILVYTLLSPILRVLHLEENSYAGHVKEYQGFFEGSMVAIENYETESELGEQQLKSYYETGIKEWVETHFDVTARTVDLEWEGAMIEGIELLVEEKLSPQSYMSLEVGDKSKSLAGDEENLKNNIKTCLSDFYNVQVCNIHITVQKK